VEVLFEEDIQTMAIHEDEPPSARTWERLNRLDDAIHDLDKHVAVSDGKRAVQHEENQRRFDDQDLALEAISKKQDQTNGNVARLQRWRDFMAGAIAAIIVLLLPIIGYILKALADKFVH
jgi:hypothetical protein